MRSQASPIPFIWICHGCGAQSPLSAEFTCTNCGEPRSLHALARALGLAALIEVHDAAELATALAVSPALGGINNRDLRSFTVDLATTERLAARIPAEICVVAESGIHGPDDLARLTTIPRPGGARGIEAIRVGEALVTAADVGAKVRELTRPGVSPPDRYAKPAETD